MEQSYANKDNAILEELGGNIFEIENTLADAPNNSDFDIDLDFSVSKKKKKKKVRIVASCDSPTTALYEDETTLNLQSAVLEPLVRDGYSDYSYDFLLTRIFDMLREKNPNLDDEAKKKLVMKPPQVLRVGTKKTSFVNFLEICRLLHRTPQHLQSFLLCELGTNGSLDGNGQLVIKGKFQQKQIEHVLRRYIREYVTCHTCHSPETLLQKDSRLCFLQCEACGSRYSVATIKYGFQAVIKRRAAMRAKEP